MVELGERGDVGDFVERGVEFAEVDERGDAREVLNLGTRNPEHGESLEGAPEGAHLGEDAVAEAELREGGHESADAGEVLIRGVRTHLQEGARLEVVGARERGEVLGGEARRGLEIRGVDRGVGRTGEAAEHAEIVVVHRVVIRGVVIVYLIVKERLVVHRRRAECRTGSTRVSVKPLRRMSDVERAPHASAATCRPERTASTATRERNSRLGSAAMRSAPDSRLETRRGTRRAPSPRLALRPGLRQIGAQKGSQGGSPLPDSFWLFCRCSRVGNAFPVVPSSHDSARRARPDDTRGAMATTRVSSPASPQLDDRTIEVRVARRTPPAS